MRESFPPCAAQHCPPGGTQWRQHRVHPGRQGRPTRGKRLYSHNRFKANFGFDVVPVSVPVTLQSSSTRSLQVYNDVVLWFIPSCNCVFGYGPCSFATKSKPLTPIKANYYESAPSQPNSGESVKQMPTVACPMTLRMWDLWCTANDDRSIPSSGHILANVLETSPPLLIRHSP